MQRQQQQTANPLRIIMGLAFLVLAIVAIFWLVKGIFTILSYLTPVLLIATLIIDHQVVLNYVKWIGRLFQNNALYGLIAVLFTVFGAPVVSLYLFGKAMLKRKIRQMTEDLENREKGTYADYDEVKKEQAFDLKEEEEIVPLEIPKTRRLKDQQNSYDDLFNDI